MALAARAAAVSVAATPPTPEPFTIENAGGKPVPDALIYKTPTQPYKLPAISDGNALDAAPGRRLLEAGE